MSNDSSTAAYVEIMRLVNEQDAQSGRFKADVQNRITGMLSRKNAPAPAQTESMSSPDDVKSFIVGYTKAVRDSFQKG